MKQPSSWNSKFGCRLLDFDFELSLFCLQAASTPTKPDRTSLSAVIIQSPVIPFSHPSKCPSIQNVVSSCHFYQLTLLFVHTARSIVESALCAAPDYPAGPGGPYSAEVEAAKAMFEAELISEEGWEGTLLHPVDLFIAD